jgi:hypothetical protein
MIHTEITLAEQADRLAIRGALTPVFDDLNGAWLFAERNLYVDWVETRTSQP